MPQGKGTYGSKRGRPAKPAKPSKPDKPSTPIKKREGQRVLRRRK